MNKPWWVLLNTFNLKIKTIAYNANKPIIIIGKIIPLKFILKTSKNPIEFRIINVEKMYNFLFYFILNVKSLKSKLFSPNFTNMNI